MKFLVPVDGSECSERAVDHLIRLARLGTPAGILLLNVREPVEGWEVHRFLTEREIAEIQRREGEADLTGARARLDAAGLAYESRIEAGPVAQTIADCAEREGCDAILLGTHGRGGLAGLLLGSVAAKVIHLALVPVTLVK